KILLLVKSQKEALLTHLLRFGRSLLRGSFRLTDVFCSYLLRRLKFHLFWLVIFVSRLGQAGNSPTWLFCRLHIVYHLKDILPPLMVTGQTQDTHSRILLKKKMLILAKQR